MNNFGDYFVMGILQQLGINETVLVQFCIFVLTITILSNVVFSKYFEAFLIREEKTKGGEALAAELQNQALELKKNYESKAKAVNGEIKTIFDEYRDQARKECENIIAIARESAQRLIDQNRQKIESQMSDEIKKMREEVPSISQAISTKLLSN